MAVRWMEPGRKLNGLPGTDVWALLNLILALIGVVIRLTPTPSRALYVLQYPLSFLALCALKGGHSPVFWLIVCVTKFLSFKLKNYIDSYSFEFQTQKHLDRGFALL